jgi:hypothetical protein
MADKFSSSDLEDVGKNREAYSGANDFDFPQTEVPQEPGMNDGTEDARDAFFSQPRRSG